MHFQIKQTYVTRSLEKELRNENEVKDHVENCIGVIIDKCSRPLSPKDKLAIHNLIIDNRSELVKLLNATIEVYGGDSKYVLK